MLSIFISIVGILITILLIVGLHELGHFLVAKWSGIKVLRFSIGFGKPLFTCHDKSGTEYVLAAIPLGGYVKMLGEEDENFSVAEKHLTYNSQPFYKKFCVIAAGPISNFLLAFVIYWVLFVVGFNALAPVIGTVAPHSIAEQAGIKPQQEIVSIDNQKMHSWINIIVYILSRAGDAAPMTMQMKDINTNQMSNYNLNLAHWHLDDLRPDPLQSLGVAPYDPVIPTLIGTVVAASPAANAGLKAGDKIIAVGGKPTTDWYSLLTQFVNKPDTTLTFTIKRAGKIINLPVKIGLKHTLFLQRYGYLGMAPAYELPKQLLLHNQYGPLEACGHAWEDVKLFVNMNFIVFGKIITGKISLRSLGGPITIFESAGIALNNGAVAFFSFLAFLSIAIGVVNILPIPGLDGGHLLFQVIEFVTRRPLNEKAQALMYRLGLLFLILVMVQAIMNDILRL